MPYAMPLPSDDHDAALYDHAHDIAETLSDAGYSVTFVTYALNADSDESDTLHLSAERDGAQCTIAITRDL